MVRQLKLRVLLMLMATAFMPTLADAFNSATHIYIAERVLPTIDGKMDLYYGSIAPDLSLFVAQSDEWPTAFDDTHYNFINLEPYTWSPNQMDFVQGWLTHNEEWGADFYAHGVRPEYQGYVTLRANLLSQQTGLDVEFMHFAIEVAIDLLLKKNDDPALGEKLQNALMMYSRTNRILLANAFVLEEKRTNWLTLFLAEVTFQNFVSQYAEAFAYPSPQDKEALAELGVQLAEELYGLSITKDELLGLLEAATALCNDYKEIIDMAIDGIKQVI